MHLQHLIPWREIVPCLQVDATEILLPVGECGRIHINDKATQIKVDHRNFISPEQICTVKDCKTVEASGCFSKDKLSPPMLTARHNRRPNPELQRKLKYFREKFYEALFEFVKTEDKKYPDEVIKNFKPPGPPKLADMPCIGCYSCPCIYNCESFIVFSLYTKNELAHLLWLDQEGKVSISLALSRTYGGQAVGNGYRFLVIYHLLPFYMAANAIIACGYESCEEKWGILSTVDKPYSFMRNIQHDCDFLTFIPYLRPYLEKDVFMKDMKKTKELLKKVFRHIYFYVFLMKKYNSCSDDCFRDEIKWTMSRCFGFNFDDC